MCQLQIGAFEVEQRLLVLSHAVDFLIPAARLKPDRQTVIAAGDRTEFPRLDLQRAAIFGKHIFPVPGILLQQHPSVLMEKGDLPRLCHDSPKLSVLDLALLFGNCNFRRGLRGTQQRPVLLRHLSLLCGAHTQAVFSPRFQP